MSKPRISRAAAKFNTYAIGTNAYLMIVIVPLHGIRLGLTAGNISDWNTKVAAWILLYAKKSDPLQKGPALNKAVRLFIADFITFATPLLNVIAASPNITSDDELVFNVVADNAHASPTHRTDPISKEIYSKLVAGGGGNIKAKGYTSTTARRAGLPPDTGADSVRRFYALSTTAINGPANYNSAGVTKEVNTGASFLMELGAENVGMYINYWDQWYDTKNPKRGGPISEKQVKLLS